MVGPNETVLTNLDTLLIALYVELADRIIPSLGFTRSGPGKPPEVTDAELVCLAVAQVAACSQRRHLVQLADRRAGQAFPDRLRPLSCPHFPVNDLEAMAVTACRT